MSSSSLLPPTPVTDELCTDMPLAFRVIRQGLIAHAKDLILQAGVSSDTITYNEVAGFQFSLIHPTTKKVYWLDLQINAIGGTPPPEALELYQLFLDTKKQWLEHHFGTLMKVCRVERNSFLLGVENVRGERWGQRMELVADAKQREYKFKTMVNEAAKHCGLALEVPPAPLSVAPKHQRQGGDR